MSVKTTHKLVCDHHEDGQRCDDSASTTGPSIQTLWAFASAVGWATVGNDDYCPEHAKEHSA